MDTLTQIQVTHTQGILSFLGEVTMMDGIFSVWTYEDTPEALITRAKNILRSQGYYATSKQDDLITAIYDFKVTAK